MTVLLLLFILFPNPALAHAPQGHTVEMTDEGVFPQYLEVRQGDTVVFKNEGKSAHWPASDIHPTHAIYSELDPKKAILPGQSWSFSFKKPGDWGLHDHLNPEFTDRIIVEEDADFIDTEGSVSVKQEELRFWEKLKFSFARFYFRLFPSRLEAVLGKTSMLEVAREEGQLRYWLRILGASKFMGELLADSGGGELVDCHQEAHQAGRAAYELFGPSAFADGDSSCHSGFYHGAMEAFLRKEGTQNLAEKITEICSTFKTSFSNFECLHGVGHGVMVYKAYDLPDALATCEELSTSFEQRSCYGGAFMENIVTAQGFGAVLQHKTEWMSEDPHFPCNAVTQDPNVQQECYLIQTSRMLDLADYDFSEIGKECLGAPDYLRKTCFQSLGRDAAGQTLRDTSGIIEICGKAPKDYFRDCIKGGLNVIVDFWGEKITDQPHQLCRALSNKEDKEFCFSQLEMRLVDVFGSN